MKTNKIKLFVCVLFVLGIASCDSKRVYDSYVSVSDQLWSTESPLEFTFHVSDTIQKNNLFINVRNNEKYAFSNLFLITALNFPNGKKIVDTLEYEMTDVQGRFLGEGITSLKENKLFYKENVVFPSSGDYSISIYHAMRKNGDIDGLSTLDGISEVGFRIEKN